MNTIDWSQDLQNAFITEDMYNKNPSKYSGYDFVSLTSQNGKYSQMGYLPSTMLGLQQNGTGIGGTNLNPQIKDETLNNIEQAINPSSVQDGSLNELLNFALTQQQMQWQREDAIRKETQEREDNAITRKVEDMLRAGINPNLALNMTGAESGGGIQQATGIDTALVREKMNELNEKDIETLKAGFNKSLQEIINSFQGDQKEKDRIAGLIDKVVNIASIIGMLFGG